MLYHDTTPYFLETLCAPQGGTVRVRVRAAAQVEGIRLMMLKTGEMHAVAMTRVHGATHNDFEGTLEVFAPTVRYIFMTTLPDDSVVLSERGVGRVLPALRDWFQFVAGATRPDWLFDRVMYQIFPDRFRNGDTSNDPQAGEWVYNGNAITTKTWSEEPVRATGALEHFGGDLAGITEALDYLEDLGVNGLYLTPIFDSPSNHRYDISDYLRVDPHLGGDAALRTLLDAAHARGMRVILDAVFNHTGNQNALFKNALAGGPERAMYTFLPDGSYEAFFGVPTLPKVDFASPLAYQTLLEGEHAPLRHWLRFGIDGWRLDVAHMMGEHGTDTGNLAVHRRLRQAVRQENPNAWVFGERFWDAEPYLQGPNPATDAPGAGEDGVMNYQGFGLPFTDWLSGRTIFGSPVQVATGEMVTRMLEVYRSVPPLVRLSHYNLLGSHDVPRLLKRLAGDAHKQLAAFVALLSFPGVPGIYYGDEIGMTGIEDGADPYNRGPFPWDETQWNTTLRDHIKTLVRARRDSLELQRGGLAWLHQDDNNIAFARPYTAEDGVMRVAICALARGPQAGVVRLDLSALGVADGAWRDVLTETRLEARSGILGLDLAQPRLLLPLP